MVDSNDYLNQIRNSCIVIFKDIRFIIVIKNQVFKNKIILKSIIKGDFI